MMIMVNVLSTVPPRLGGPPLRPARPPTPTLSLHDDIPPEEIEVYEDQSQDAVAIAVEEDVNPPDESDGRMPFQQLSTNILGIRYRGDPLIDDESDGSDDEGNDDGGGLGDTQQMGAQQEAVQETQHNKVPDVTTDDMPTEIQLPAAEEDIRMEKENNAQEIIADGPVDGLGKKVNDFHLAMMLFVTSSDISRAQYKALTEVLALATPEGLSTLPKSIRTLKENTRRAFPISNIKARRVGVSTDLIPPKTENPRLAYYFDVSEYCKLWMSDAKLNIHTDMGVIVDNPTELWHGNAWMESVRSTSGKFARINGDSPTVLESILLPSDCVKFKDDTGNILYGRVKSVGIDGRKTPQGTYPTNRSYLAVINRLLPVNEVPPQFHRRPQSRDDLYPRYPSTLPELVLFESRDIIPCSDIISKIWVYFTDYRSPESLKNSLLPHAPTFCVRHIVYVYGGTPCTRPVHKRHRVAAENELMYLTRRYVLENLVDRTPGAAMAVGQAQASYTPCVRHISIPFSVFLDGFGLYRNAYHILKGMYVTPAGLDTNARSQMANMFVLMIGPFGSNEMEMAACLSKDSELIGRGFSTELQNGEKVFITAFPLLFTGDMPQQNQNSGNKTHNAEYGCRYCFVHDSSRGNLLLDVHETGRYQAPSKLMYKKAMSIGTKGGRAAALQKIGLTAEGPYFTKCYPMLDPQRSNPNDPMHAELRLCKYFSDALIEGMLSPSGILAYREAWNDVEVPYGWGQPQNPVSHKGSMVFSEHGRMAIMNPFVLMHLFTNEHSKHSIQTKTYLKAGIEARTRATFCQELDTQHEAKLCILKTSYALAKTVHMTLKKSLTIEEQRNLHLAVYQVCDSSCLYYPLGRQVESQGKFYSDSEWYLDP